MYNNILVLTKIFICRVKCTIKYKDTNKKIWGTLCFTYIATHYMYVIYTYAPYEENIATLTRVFELSYPLIFENC